MDTVQDKYTHPTPILYRYKGYPEVSLASNDFDNVKNLTVTTSQNETSTLTFEIPFSKDRKLNVDSCEKLVKFENEYYIIKNIVTENNTDGNMKVTCKHESEELKGVYCTYIDLIGVSPQEMFNKIMSSTMHPVDMGYKWAGTDIDVSKKRHLQTDSECSVYQNLISMASVFNGWLEIYTDINEQKWVYLRSKAINNNKFIKKDLDMKSLNITYSTEEIFTRLEPFGYTDKDGIELNIMSVNPTRKSYIENYSWYIGMGIPDSVIKKEAKYQQLKVMRETEYTNGNDLLDLAKEELAKCCKPQLDATLTMSDLSVYVNSLDESPKVGYQIRCIDADIDFVFDCTITGVERNYDNPMETKIEISNVIRYDTTMQNINHTIDSNNSITGSNSNGAYVPAEKVVVDDGGDHVNVTKKFGNQQTLITQNYDEIKLTAENLGKSIGEVSVKADNISLSVTNLDESVGKISVRADNIKLSVNDLTTNTNSSINMLSKKIESKVSEGEMWSSIEESPNRITQTIYDGTEHKCEFTSDGLAVYNGAFTVLDKRGNIVFRFNTSGTAGITSLEIKDTSKGSPFYNTLMNMNEISCGEIKPNRLTLRHGDFYIDNGYDLKDYIEKILSSWKLI